MYFFLSPPPLSLSLFLSYFFISFFPLLSFYISFFYLSPPLSVYPTLFSLISLFSSHLVFISNFLSFFPSLPLPSTVSTLFVVFLILFCICFFPLCSFNLRMLLTQLLSVLKHLSSLLSSRSWI